MSDKERIELEVVQAIKESSITLFNEVAVKLNTSIDSLYEMGLNKSENVIQALNSNRVQLKQRLRSKWADSDNPALQLALYKLLADEDELKKLTTTSNNNHSTGDLSVTWKETKTYDPGNEYKL